MGKKETENDVKKIADQIDAKMLDYLNLPLFEQLDKVRNDVLSSQESLDLLKRGKKKKKESRLTVVKILDKVKNDLMTEAGQLEQVIVQGAADVVVFFLELLARLAVAEFARYVVGVDRDVAVLPML